MAAARGVWAIDIGTTSLKALRLTRGAEGLEVIGFSHIEHSQPLTSEGVGIDDREQIISETLHQFLEANDIGKEEVGISIAGQNSFSRFIKLPPVEPKKIPEIVQFEAVQQIPFDINEVEWDWQLMENENSPDKEVGLFAIKNELISEMMDHFNREKLRVTCVQIAPMALYNFAYYDRTDVAESTDQATIILDMGAENTTLVICTKDSVWQRSIRIGGNTFTQAIADTFKKDFRVSEKLKRTAPMSKYMRQIYTAMKPVYTDLGGEIQRSLGFYSSSPQGRDKTFSKMIALGGGMKLQGLAKYLTQTLGMSVVKPDSFERLVLSPDVSSAQFHENVSDFGVVYGLGAQLLGEAKISTNLLPRRLARAMTWSRKARMFTIAASVLLLVMVLGLAKAFKDSKQYGSNEPLRRQIQAAVNQVNTVKKEINEQEARQQPLLDKIEKENERFEYRDVLPKFHTLLLQCLPNKENTPSQAELYDAFASGDVKKVLATPRSERKQLFVTRIAVDFTDDVATAGFPAQQAGTRRVVRQRFSGRDDLGVDRAMMDRIRQRNTRTTPAVGTPAAAGEQEPQQRAGFTVLIEGYSPYRKISELLDPPMVGDDQNRWGVITRFENIDKLFDDMPFELFNKRETKHFNVKSGLVDLIEPSPEMPAGIGIEKVVERVPRPQTAAGAVQPGLDRRNMMNTRNTPDYIYDESVLIDPMTGEEISRTYDIITQEDVDARADLTERDLGRIELDNFGDEIYIERDRWFRIQAKFVWKNAPKVEATSVGGVMTPARRSSPGSL
jgi:type IV pilus assembly protein PilM